MNKLIYDDDLKFRCYIVIYRAAGESQELESHLAHQTNKQNTKEQSQIKNSFCTDISKKKPQKESVALASAPL